MIIEAVQGQGVGACERLPTRSLARQGRGRIREALGVCEARPARFLEGRLRRHHGSHLGEDGRLVGFAARLEHRRDRSAHPNPTRQRHQRHVGEDDAGEEAFARADLHRLGFGRLQ